MGLFERASAQFETYAAMNEPDLPQDKWSALQVRLARWQNREYGPQPDWAYVLGIVEELGECAGARTGAESTDAIGDVVIYMVQLCTSLRLDAGTLYRSRYDTDRDTASEIGRIAHCTLKQSQGIRGMADKDLYRESQAEAMVGLFYFIDQERLMLGLDTPPMLDLVTTVAEHVMSRVKAELPRVAQ